MSELDLLAECTIELTRLEYAYEHQKPHFSNPNPDLLSRLENYFKTHEH
jgi:hypothetical protein